jgi:hypothetical protein
MPVQPCPRCGQSVPRWLEASSRDAWVNYYRCDQCGHVWAVAKPGKPDPNTLKLPPGETPPRDLSTTGLEFLRTELATGHTFVRLAQDATESPETRQRNRINAQTAYLAILRFAPRLAMTDEERAAIMQRVEELQRAIAAIPD